MNNIWIRYLLKTTHHAKFHSDPTMWMVSANTQFAIVIEKTISGVHVSPGSAEILVRLVRRVYTPSATSLPKLPKSVDVRWSYSVQHQCRFTARRSYASAVLGVVILSVRLVCPSVCHTRALWLIQRTYRRYFYTIWKDNPSSFVLPTVVGGRRLLPPKMGDRSDPPSKISHVDRFSPVTCQQ